MFKFIFWLILIIALNFFMYFYVFLKLFFLFNIEKMGLTYILAFFISIMIILATIFLRRWHNFFTLSFYKLSGFLLGVFFLTFICLIFFELLTVIYPLHEKKLIIASMAVSFILISYSLTNARSIDVKTVEISDFGVKLKIVQISDLHLTSSKTSEKLSEIVEKINSLNPEMIVITGDMVSQDTPINKKTFSPLQNLHAKTYFVTGNHEYYTGDVVSDLIEEAGITVLRNEVDFFNGIQIVGLEYTPNKNKAQAVLSELKIDKAKPALLLIHVPTEPKSDKIKLTLSGHTHYGQIFPFNFIVRLAIRYIKGLYKLKNGYIYVSPGTGTWGPPMRLGSKNEITVFDLR